MINSKTYDVVIVGGGISAITLALFLENKKILIVEKNDKILKKILSTGNGRCNISNTQISTQFYNDDRIKTIIQKQKNFLDLFVDKGIDFREIDGRIYPRSETATGLVSFLVNKINQNKNITVLTSVKVIKISEGLVETEKGVYRGKNVVVALGSNANSKEKEENIKRILPEGIKFINFKPSLVNLKCDTKYFKGLKGLRSKCLFSVYENDGQLLFEEFGEIIFKEDGLSGIPALQASSYIARGKKIRIVINFAYGISEEEFYKIYKLNPNFDGVFTKNLPNNILNYSSDHNIGLYDSFTKFELDSILLGDMINAQVASGGVSLDCVDINTLEDKRRNNIYYIGEILNIDGLCGGYNISWAMMSALTVANHINEIGVNNAKVF